MNIQKSVPYFDEFKYIDSSQEEQDIDQWETTQENRALSKQIKKQINEQTNNNQYKQEIKELIKNQINKIEGGRILMVTVNDKMVEQNMRMRKEKYEYFGEIMQIDERYNKIQGEKVRRLKEQNLRKQQILQRKRAQNKQRQQELMLRKYIIQKKSKQEQVIKGAKKISHKLTVERKVHTVHHIKTQIQNEKQLTQQQLHNLKKKQQNQLEQLREKYQQLKVEKRVNKLDQQKVLRDLQKQNERQKKQLKEQLLVKDSFKV